MNNNNTKRFHLGKYNPSTKPKNKTLHYFKTKLNSTNKEKELLMRENKLLVKKLKRLEKRNIKEVVKYNNATILANTAYSDSLKKLTNDAIAWEEQFNNIRTLIQSIKRLTNNETIKSICDNVEYLTTPVSRIPVTDDFNINDILNDDVVYNYVDGELFIDELISPGYDEYECDNDGCVFRGTYDDVITHEAECNLGEGGDGGVGIQGAGEE